MQVARGNALQLSESVADLFRCVSKQLQCFKTTLFAMAAVAAFCDLYGDSLDALLIWEVQASRPVRLQRPSVTTQQSTEILGLGQMNLRHDHYGSSWKYNAPRWQKEEREEKPREQEEAVDENVLMVDPIAGPLG